MDKENSNKTVMPLHLARVLEGDGSAEFKQMSKAIATLRSRASNGDSIAGERLLNVLGGFITQQTDWPLPLRFLLLDLLSAIGEGQDPRKMLGLPKKKGRPKDVYGEFAIYIEVSNERANGASLNQAIETVSHKLSDGINIETKGGRQYTRKVQDEREIERIYQKYRKALHTDTESVSQYTITDGKITWINPD